MPIITSIKPQKNKKRVNIYLDQKFAFGLDLENFLKLGLKVEQQLSEEEIEKIIKKTEFQKTLDKLLRFATLRPRSEKEFREWLKKHKVHKSLHSELFNKLKRLELLDDTKFARWWVGQRIQFKFKSKREIIHELRIKGIEDEVISQVLEEIEINEEKMARELLEKKKYRWENLPRLEARRKMSEFLGRKGFEWEVIKRVIEDITDY